MNAFAQARSTAKVAALVYEAKACLGDIIPHIRTAFQNYSENTEPAELPQNTPSGVEEKYDVDAAIETLTQDPALLELQAAHLDRKLTGGPGEPYKEAPLQTKTRNMSRHMALAAAHDGDMVTALMENGMGEGQAVHACNPKRASRRAKWRGSLAL